MEPDLWECGAETLERWARAVDEGPFASLCFGERMAFDNPETLVLLGAVRGVDLAGAARDDRDRPAAARPGAAREVAGDRPTGCRGGRLTVGFGVGGREEDYRAVGADPATQTMRGMASRVAPS